MASKTATIGTFISDAPPGELTDVVNDIKALTTDEPTLLSSQDDVFLKYHEEQFATVKVPDSSNEVMISEYNKLEDGRYFDLAVEVSFGFDPVSQRVTDVQSYSSNSKHSELVRSIYRFFTRHTSEHFPSSTAGVFPYSSDSKIALIVVANKYSPNNFWNGRWRSQYILDPSSSAIVGNIRVDVHYYEDGNVRLQTVKPITATASSGSATEVVRAIASAEKRYQEDLNRSFTQLSEGVFRGLRRQLPVTRQKIEWEKIGGYRLGQDIGGGRSH